MRHQLRQHHHRPDRTTRPGTCRPTRTNSTSPVGPSPPIRDGHSLLTRRGCQKSSSWMPPSESWAWQGRSGSRRLQSLASATNRACVGACRKRFASHPDHSDVWLLSIDHTSPHPVTFSPARFQGTPQVTLLTISLLLSTNEFRVESHGPHPARSPRLRAGSQFQNVGLGPHAPPLHVYAQAQKLWRGAMRKMVTIGPHRGMVPRCGTTEQTQEAGRGGLNHPAAQEQTWPFPVTLRLPTRQICNR